MCLCVCLCACLCVCVHICVYQTLKVSLGKVIHSKPRKWTCVNFPNNFNISLPIIFGIHLTMANILP